MQSNGFNYIFLVVGAIFFLSSVIVGGVNPKIDDTKTVALADYTIDISSIPQDGGDTVQLKTFGLKQCGSNTAIDLLIDNSGSMAYGSKMENLKGALATLEGSFPDSGVITMQTYSVYPVELLPFNKLFGDSRFAFLKAVNSMHPIEATHSKDAFIFAKSKLDAGRPKFPKHKFAMIFISDGIPETAETNNRCPGGKTGPICGPHPSNPSYCRCFASSQDPREIADQIKQSGVRIFTIAYTETEDKKYDILLKNMMSNIASSPKDAYTAPDSNQILDILKQIKNKLCEDTPALTTPNPTP